MSRQPLEAFEVAHDEHGHVAIVSVGDRSFVHGSILDRECAKADKRIAELEAFIAPIARRADEMEFVARDDGVNNNTVVAVLTFEQAARARELLRKS